jgi:cohesin loading factor subunit SCC2
MLRGRTLQCLGKIVPYELCTACSLSLLRIGFLFRAQPTLMTKERSASVMDAIFASPDEDGKGRILRIMQEFLVSESEKSSAKLKGELTSWSVRS